MRSGPPQGRVWVDQESGWHAEYRQGIGGSGCALMPGDDDDRPRGSRRVDTSKYIQWVGSGMLCIVLADVGG